MLKLVSFLRRKSRRADTRYVRRTRRTGQITCLLSAYPPLRKKHFLFRKAAKLFVLSMTMRLKESVLICCNHWNRERVALHVRHVGTLGGIPNLSVLVYSLSVLVYSLSVLSA